jgi:hypothetical protein
MAKRAPSQKLINLMGTFVERARVFVREDEPKVAIYYAVMVHGLFILALSMQGDGQLSQDLWGEAGKHEAAARRIIARLGGEPSLGAKRIPSELGDMLKAYHHFLADLETGPWGDL